MGRDVINVWEDNISEATLETYLLKCDAELNGGKKRGAVLVCLENHVSLDTPPVFIWHTADDGLVPVENSLLFAKSMREKGRPFEMHIYQKGPQGISLANEGTSTENTQIDNRVAAWINLCTSWLKEVV